MIWRVTKPGARNRSKQQWHDWFAWYPVRVPTKGRMSRQHKVWLQKVRRRGTLECGYDFDTWWHWRYVLPGDEYYENRTPKYAPMPECKPPREPDDPPAPPPKRVIREGVKIVPPGDE